MSPVSSPLSDAASPLSEKSEVDDRSGGRKARCRASDEAAEIQSRFALALSPAVLRCPISTVSNFYRVQFRSMCEQGVYRVVPTYCIGLQVANAENVRRCLVWWWHLWGFCENWFWLWHVAETYSRYHSSTEIRWAALDVQRVAVWYVFPPNQGGRVAVHSERWRIMTTPKNRFWAYLGRPHRTLDWLRGEGSFLSIGMNNPV